MIKASEVMHKALTSSSGQSTCNRLQAASIAAWTARNGGAARVSEACAGENGDKRCMQNASSKLQEHAVCRMDEYKMQRDRHTTLFWRYCALL